MQRKWIAICVFVIAGCAKETTPASLSAEVSQVRSGRRSFSCQMSPAECEQLSSAIATLENHPEYMCRDLGTAARARYSDPSATVGFKKVDQHPSFDSYVTMHWVGKNVTISGYAPDDGLIQMCPSFLNLDTEIQAGLIAHEETHQNGGDGVGDNTGAGPYWQNSCTG